MSNAKRLIHHLHHLNWFPPHQFAEDAGRAACALALLTSNADWRAPRRRASRIDNAILATALPIPQYVELAANGVDEPASQIDLELLVVTVDGISPEIVLNRIAIRNKPFAEPFTATGLKQLPSSSPDLFNSFGSTCTCFAINVVEERIRQPLDKTAAAIGPLAWQPFQATGARFVGWHPCPLPLIQFDGQPDELGPLALPVLFQPVRHHEPRRVALRFRQHRRE